MGGAGGRGGGTKLINSDGDVRSVCRLRASRRQSFDTSHSIRTGGRSVTGGMRRVVSAFGFPLRPHSLQQVTFVQTFQDMNGTWHLRRGIRRGRDYDRIAGGRAVSVRRMSTRSLDRQRLPRFKMRSQKCALELPYLKSHNVSTSAITTSN